MRVADKIATYLADKRVRHAFTIIGAGNVCILDAIADQGKIEIVPMHHEQAATMAATYYYRTRGVLAPVIVTMGAGSSNTHTGVIAGYMDSIPAIIIGGNEQLSAFRNMAPRVHGVQGFRAAELIKPACKYSAQALTSQDAMTILDQCYRFALESRQGPCWLDLPRDIAAAECK